MFGAKKVMAKKNRVRLPRENVAEQMWPGQWCPFKDGPRNL